MTAPAGQTPVEVTEEQLQAAHTWVATWFEGECEHGEDDDLCTHLARAFVERDAKVREKTLWEAYQTLLHTDGFTTNPLATIRGLMKGVP